jgi:heme/copper-type cytochrome/quinol oxidase subunit 3
VTLPHGTHGDPALRGSMARWGTASMITSWTMFALAIYLGYLYLDALDTQRAFRAGESAPSTLGTVLLTVGALAGALVWSWAYRTSRSRGAVAARAGVTLGWLLSLAGLIASVLIFLSYKAPLPLHAYASSMDLFILFHGWHLVVALAIGAIVLGRLYRGRIEGREYTIQITGWWLWYTAITAVVMMVLTLAVR